MALKYTQDDLIHDLEAEGREAEDEIQEALEHRRVIRAMLRKARRKK